MAKELRLTPTLIDEKLPQPVDPNMQIIFDCFLTFTNLEKAGFGFEPEL